MAIGKETDPRNDHIGFENKLHDKKKDYCRETLSSKADTNMEYNIPTNYDSNEIYLIPVDANWDPEYISTEYSKGILQIQCISLIIGVDGPSIFC